jgi:type IV pilus assembly protein PilB
VSDTRLGAVADDAARALASSSEEEQARALAARCGLEFVDVASFAPDPEILKSVPVELMFRYAFLPYRREGDRLVLVMADPTAIPVVD